jgi:putative exosortase-associated protein (TIGR04073 family)
MTVLIAVILIFTLMTSSLSFATGPLYETSRASKITRKLLRGIGNICFCLVEIPLEINKEIQKLDFFTGFFTGLGKGVVQSWKRAVSGCWEVLTFPIEIPEDYRPIIEPEFPMMDVVD